MIHHASELPFQVGLKQAEGDWHSLFPYSKAVTYLDPSGIGLPGYHLTLSGDE